jgi:hypothetical protein
MKMRVVIVLVRALVWSVAAFRLTVPVGSACYSPFREALTRTPPQIPPQERVAWGTRRDCVDEGRSITVSTLVSSLALSGPLCIYLLVRRRRTGRRTAPGPARIDLDAIV